MIREARPVDLDAIEKIYDNIHAAEESGKAKIGWISGIYPVRATAEEAIRRRDMFVFEENGQILAAAIINKTQVDVYNGANWSFEAGDDEVCVLHTLVIDPNCSGRGVGSRFVEFYEKYAPLAALHGAAHRYQRHKLGGAQALRKARLPRGGHRPLRF